MLTKRISTHILAFLIVSLVSLTLFLVGCTGAAVEPVTFAIFGDPEELAAYEALVAAFAEEHPDLPIELRHTPGQSDYRRQLATEFAAGDPPDIMLLNYRRFAIFAEEGGLEPLESYLADSDLLATEDFFPITLESFIYDGQLWCIPQNLSSLVVYYNQDLFDAANVPYPANDWTWDDFVEAARQLTQDTDGDGTVDQYGAGLEGIIFRLAPFIWQNGGELVDDPIAPTRLTLDNPAALAAFQWFVDLQVKEQVVPDAVAEESEGSESRFLNGRLAMFFNSRRGVPTYRTISDFTWDVAPLPTGPVSNAGILHSDAYCMAANTENKEDAWTFIEFANSEAGQRIIARSGRTVPSLMSVAESADFLDPNLPPANSRIFIDTAATLRTVPILPTWPGIEETADNEIQRAFYGQVSVEEAAASAAAITQQYFDELQGP